MVFIREQWKIPKTSKPRGNIWPNLAQVKWVAIKIGIYGRKLWWFLTAFSASEETLIVQS